MDNRRVLPPTKKKIARSFGLKATRYEEHAFIQTMLLKRLLAMIADNGTHEGIWADIGCGSGVLSRLVRERRMESMTLIGMDLACESVRCFNEGAGKGSRGIVGDIDAPPFKPDSLSGMVLASVLQWLAQPEAVVTKAAETLRIGGICAFSIFVNDSFFELFETRRAQHLAIPVQCPGAGQVKILFSSGQFKLVRYELLRQTMYFPDARSLLKNISSTGAGATPGKRLMRGEVDRFCACYEKKFHTDKGIPLTWQAAIGIAEKRTRA